MKRSPNETFTATLTSAPSGLVGSLTVQINDGEDPVTSPTTVGISEVLTEVYEVELTAPATAGSYLIVWTAEGKIAVDELEVTFTAHAGDPVEPGLLSLAEYKAARGITDTKQDPQIESALLGATQAVIDYIERDILAEPTVATKRYPYEFGETIVNIDDAVSISSVVIVSAGVPRTLTVDREYVPGQASNEPVISWVEVVPAFVFYDPIFDFTHVVTRPYLRPLPRIEVTGVFGWPGPPPASARQAAIWLVDEILSSAPAPTTASGGGLAAESIADLSYTYRGEESTLTPPILPPRVQQILTPLKRTSV